MTDIKIGTTGAPQGLPTIKPAPAEGETGSGFEGLVQEALGKMTQVQSDAEKAVKELAAGGDPTEAIIAMGKADRDFQVMVEVRNKLINAYQQIMNMQV